MIPNLLIRVEVRRIGRKTNVTIRKEVGAEGLVRDFIHAFRPAFPVENHLPSSYETQSQQS